MSLSRDELHRTVARVVRAIPRGRVLSYSRVAVLAGLPGRARLVGKVMGRIGGQLPWWRVLRADRTMAEEVRVEQARRLRAEGVKVQDGGRVPRSAFLPIGDEALHRRIRAGSSARGSAAPGGRRTSGLEPRRLRPRVSSGGDGE